MTLDDGILEGDKDEKILSTYTKISDETLIGNIRCPYPYNFEMISILNEIYYPGDSENDEICRYY